MVAGAMSSPWPQPFFRPHALQMFLACELRALALTLDACASGQLNDPPDSDLLTSSQHLAKLCDSLASTDALALPTSRTHFRSSLSAPAITPA